jgi:hypothetical protein
MEIKLQTRKGSDIINETYIFNVPRDLNYLYRLHQRDYPDVVLFRRGIDISYNCHGLTFANRRTCIADPDGLEILLSDDGYRPIGLSEVKPGDIVIYRDEGGDIAHSGIVLAIERAGELRTPIILSKWGAQGPECIHKYNYGPILYVNCIKEFWTDRKTNE